MGFSFPFINSPSREFLTARMTAPCGISGTSAPCHLKALPCPGFLSDCKYRQQQGRESTEKASSSSWLSPEVTPITYTPFLLVRTTPKAPAQCKESWEMESLAGQSILSDDSALWNQVRTSWWTSSWPCLRSCKILSVHISDVCFHPAAFLPSGLANHASNVAKKSRVRKLVYNGFLNQYTHPIPSTLCH